MNLEHLRDEYHRAICSQVLGYEAGVLNVADGGIERSIELAQGMLAHIGSSPCPNPPERNEAEILFVALTRDYLEKAFHLVQHLRPGDWTFSL